MCSELTAFVVGSGETEARMDFKLELVDGTPNLRMIGELPPLNRTGLRRLAQHLEALATLLEYSKPQRVTRIERQPYRPGPLLGERDHVPCLVCGASHPLGRGCLGPVRLPAGQP